jgi:hypothetical protein
MPCTRYVFDSQSSQLTVQAFAEGVAGIVDHRPVFCVREFSGEIEFDRDKLDGSLMMTAKAGSLEIKDEVTPFDRKAIERVLGEILRPNMFPEVAFRSSRVVCSEVGENLCRADISGIVSLHKMQKAQAIQAQLVLSEGSIRAYGEFRLRQTNFGLVLASVAGAMLRIKDELKVLFFVVARS